MTFHIHKYNYFYGLHGDWETRRWFAGFGLKQVENKIENYKEQYYKLGIAPYLGDYGDFHTWIIVKTKEISLDNKKHLVLPKDIQSHPVSEDTIHIDFFSISSKNPLSHA